VSCGGGGGGSCDCGAKGGCGCDDCASKRGRRRISGPPTSGGGVLLRPRSASRRPRRAEACHRLRIIVPSASVLRCLPEGGTLRPRRSYIDCVGLLLTGGPLLGTAAAMEPPQSPTELPSPVLVPARAQVRPGIPESPAGAADGGIETAEDGVAACTSRTVMRPRHGTLPSCGGGKHADGTGREMSPEIAQTQPGGGGGGAALWNPCTCKCTCVSPWRWKLDLGDPSDYRFADIMKPPWWWWIWPWPPHGAARDREIAAWGGPVPPQQGGPRRRRKRRRGGTGRKEPGQGGVDVLLPIDSPPEAIVQPPCPWCGQLRARTDRILKPASASRAPVVQPMQHPDTDRPVLASQSGTRDAARGLTPLEQGLAGASRSLGPPPPQLGPPLHAGAPAGVLVRSAPQALEDDMRINDGERAP